MFSRKLSKVIEERGLSKYQIAQVTKISQATLSNYCKGKVKPTLSIVKQLAEFLEVDLDWLLEEDGETSGTDRVEEPAANFQKKKHLSAGEQIELLKEQLVVKDELIVQLTKIVEEKLDVLIDNIQSGQR